MRMRGFFALAVMAPVLALGAAYAADDGGSAGDTIAFVRKGNVWLAKADGSGQRRLTDSGACGGPALAPDAKQVAFHCRGEKDIHPHTGFGQIYLVPASGGKARQLKLEGIQAAEHPAFSPDGKTILFVGLSDAKTRSRENAVVTLATMSVSTADLGTGNRATLIRKKNVRLDAGYVYSHPVFSPDGESILHQRSGSDVSGGFAVTDLKGKTRFQYPLKTSDPTPFWRPSATPDGKEILCYSPATTEGADDIIWLVDRQKGTRRKIADGANPVFVSGGKAIVFERWTNRWGEKASSDLWILGLKPGASPRRIIPDASEPAGPMLRK